MSQKMYFSMKLVKIEPIRVKPIKAEPVKSSILKLLFAVALCGALFFPSQQVSAAIPIPAAPDVAAKNFFLIGFLQCQGISRKKSRCRGGTGKYHQIDDLVRGV